MWARADSPGRDAQPARSRVRRERARRDRDEPPHADDGLAAAQRRLRATVGRLLDPRSQRVRVQRPAGQLLLCRRHRDRARVARLAADTRAGGDPGERNARRSPWWLTHRDRRTRTLRRSRRTHSTSATALATVGPQAGATASHTFTAAGTYTVTTTVTDTLGLSAQTTRQVTVSAGDAPPAAALSVTPAGGTAPLPVTADASGSTDTDATPISTYSFDFGDGSAVVGPQAGATATHTYAAAGTYTVTVTVADTGGLSSKATKQVTVSGTGPTEPRRESRVRGRHLGLEHVRLGDRGHSDEGRRRSQRRLVGRSSRTRPPRTAD